MGIGEAYHACKRRPWLDYDPVALAVLVIGIGMIELLALRICPIFAVLEARLRRCRLIMPSQSGANVLGTKSCWYD